MTESLLQRYFTNQVSPDEARRVLDWFTTEEGRLYLTTRLNNQLGAADWHAPPDVPAPDADQLLNAIRQRIASAQSQPTIRRINWFSQPIRWAAVFVGALLLATGTFFGYRALNPADLVEHTAFGKTTRLTLPDGSTVALNGNSCLRYAPSWKSGQTREVWLEGEGFFQVTHQRNHERFVVHLPNKLNIEVLGTQFNVLARKSHAKVVLTTGKIQLDVGNQTSQKLVMHPGDLVYADVATKEYYRRRVDAEAQSAWRTGKLKFDGITLLEVAQMLEDTYGVQITITDPDLRRQTLSGTIPNQSMQTILNGLSTVFDLRITQHTNQITIQRTSHPDHE
ncbi:FecR domain-containing protein [Spirosoma sp. SC4-14]|uniref:FecR family protein n=1 Tax=Spirosoma sp. SC4-14 TaxID=3128900 RepID=UPI0030D2A186